VSLERVQIRPADPRPGKLSAYTISFSASAEFSESDILYVTFPSELTLEKASGADRCASVFAPEAKVSCSEKGANKLKITGLFPENDRQYAVMIQAVTNMQQAGSTSNFIIEVKDKKDSSKAEKRT